MTSGPVPSPTASAPAAAGAAGAAAETACATDRGPGTAAETPATVGSGGAPRAHGSLLERLAECDRAASNLVGVALPHPPRLTRALATISRCGDHGLIWYAMAAVPLLARRPGRGARFTYVAGGVLTAELVNFAVKLRVRRDRPSQAPEDGGNYIKVPPTHSFPSAHATMSVVGVATMGRLYPRLKAPLTGLAALLAFTRAYLRVHYPGDVAAGLGFGMLVAAVYTRLVRAPLPARPGAAPKGPSRGGRS